MDGLGLKKGAAIMTATEKYKTENYKTDKWADRTVVVDLELTDEEEAILTARASEKGLTVEEYIRTLMGCPP